MSSSQPTPPSFQDILQSANLPEPGPEYYAARRRLWLTPRPETGTLPLKSPARQEIADRVALHQPRPWNSAMDKQWQRLTNGKPLKHPLPLHFIISLIHAYWIHDQTWPAGMEVPASDEEQQEEERIIPVVNSSATTSSAPTSSTRIPLSAVTSGNPHTPSRSIPG